MHPPKLCCLVNWVRRCSLCDFYLCVSCWDVAIKENPDEWFSSRVHHRVNPECKSQMIHKCLDGVIREFDANGNPIR